MGHRNFIPFPVLTTQRLLLRQLNIKDAAEIFALRSDEIVNKYLDRQRANSIQDAEEFIKKIGSNISSNQSVFWAICLKGETKLAGTICLWNFSEDEQKAEIGYELLPAFFGKGIMQEALMKVIEYGFAVLQLQTIEAWTTAQNLPSINILERNQFKRDTVAETQIDRAHEGEDTVIYSLHQST